MDIHKSKGYSYYRKIIGAKHMYYLFDTYVFESALQICTVGTNTLTGIVTQDWIGPKMV